jgi:phosphate transport system substrate-binding protein
MPSPSASFALLVVLTLGLACSDTSRSSASSARIVRVDGSSTVFPISAAILKEFSAADPRIRVTVGISGTGGGFQKFCRGKIDVSAAARPIGRAEIETCHQNGVTFIELPIAYDGIAIVVNPQATWISDITVNELRAVWAPEAEGRVTRWSQVRAGWPDREIHLVGAGIDSGTYDYFTAAIMGRERASRTDFTSSEDDNVLATAVATDELALGFLPLAYYDENRHRLKVVPVDSGNAHDGLDAVGPTPQTIRNGTYQPLSRPIFIYVREQALNRPGVEEFVDFYLAHAGALAQKVGYLEFDAEAYELIAQRRNARWTGSAFGEGGSQVGLTIEQLLDKARIP